MKYHSTGIILFAIAVALVGCEEDVENNDDTPSVGYLYTFNDRKIGTPANSTALLPGGDLVICGNYIANGVMDGDIYRVNNTGNQIWRTNPSPADLYTNIKGVVVHPIGDIFVCGNSSGFGSPTGSDVFLARLTPAGDTVWTRSLLQSGTQSAICLALAGDGGLIVASNNTLGTGGSEVVLTKFNVSDSVLWTNAIPVTYSLNVTHIEVCSNGDILISGISFASMWSAGEPKLIRTDANGNVIWSKTYALPNLTFPNSVTELTNGDLMVCGSAEYYPYTYLAVIRLNSAGDTLWTKYKTDSLHITTLNSLLELDANSIVIGGSAPGALDFDADNYIFKINSNGGLVWERQFGSSQNNCAMNLVRDGDRILITGESGSNVYLARIGLDGVLK